MKFLPADRVIVQGIIRGTVIQVFYHRLMVSTGRGVYLFPKKNVELIKEKEVKNERSNSRFN